MGEQNNGKNERYYNNIIKEAELTINGVAENIQEATLKQYKTVVKRLVLADQKPIETAKSKGGYYAYRAAWIGYHAITIREKLLLLDNLKSTDLKRWQGEVEELPYFIKQLKVCEPDPKRKQRQIAIDYEKAISRGEIPEFDYSNEWREKAAAVRIEKESKSKKALTRKLPIGWRDKIFQTAFDKQSKHMLAIAIMICSGCRPKELQNGINLKLDPETAEIHILITCAKKQGHKVEVRRFTIKNNSQAFNYLLSQLLFHEGQMLLRDINYKAVSSEVGRLSEKVIDPKTAKISPYSFRHCFSGDLHAEKLSREEIAQALGHKTDKTQSYYSHSKKHSTTGFNICNIDSTETVKVMTVSRINDLLNLIDNERRLH